MPTRSLVPALLALAVGCASLPATSVAPTSADGWHPAAAVAPDSTQLEQDRYACHTTALQNADLRARQSTQRIYTPQTLRQRFYREEMIRCMGLRGWRWGVPADSAAPAK